MGKSTIAMIIVILMLLVGIGAVSKLYVDKSTESALRLEYIEQLQVAIVNLNQQILDEQLDNKRIITEKESIAASFRHTKDRLLKMKPLLKEAVADPESIRIVVQKSYDKFVSDIQCLTGDLAQCAK